MYFLVSSVFPNLSISSWNPRIGAVPPTIDRDMNVLWIWTETNWEGRISKMNPKEKLECLFKTWEKFTMYGVLIHISMSCVFYFKKFVAFLPYAMIFWWEFVAFCTRSSRLHARRKKDDLRNRTNSNRQLVTF